MVASQQSAKGTERTPAFTVQEKHTLNDVIRQFPQKKYRKGEVIYTPEETAQDIYFIHDGRVKIVSYSLEGKELIKKLFGQGDFFGEGALLRRQPRHNFAIANTPMTISVLPVVELRPLLQQDPQLNLFFLGLFSRQLIELEQRLESIVFQSSRSRILAYLVDLIEEKGERVGFEWVLRRFMSHQDIANITATSRQSVNSVLNELRRAEVLTFNRRRLLVRDLDRLRQIARRARQQS